MKFEFDIDLEKLADLVAARIQGPAPDKAPVVPKQADAPKTAAKPAGKAKPAVGAPTREQVHAALTAYMKDKGKDPAIAILKKYAVNIGELKEADFAKVLADLAGEPAPAAAPEAEDDPFA